MTGTFYLFCGSVFVGALSSMMLLNFAQRDVSWFSFFTSLLGFVLSFGIIALVPYDVWQALESKDAPAKLQDEAVVEWGWELIYWATFLLCWLLCPVLIEYEAAGDFTTVGRLRASLRRNAAWYGVYLIIGALILLWFTIGGSTQGGLVPYLIAASNAWGLLVSMVLMGHGLVAVPRHLWRLASPAHQLKTLYCAAVPMDEARLGTQFELQDVINEARVEVASRSVRLWDPKLERAFSILQQTLEDSELLHSELTSGASNRQTGHDCGLPRVGGSVGGRMPRQQPTGNGMDAARLDCLVQLHRDLKQASLESRRAACRWDELVAKCIHLEDLEENLLPSAVELAMYWQGTCFRALCRQGCVRGCWHASVHFWMRTLRPRVLRFCGAFCACLSVAIVLGQLTMFSNRWSLSLLSLFFLGDHGFGVTQAFCIVPLSYIVCTAYWSIFRLKIAGWYGLYSNHNTDTGSLLWCASILARLSAPLCYHFLLLIRVEGTAFQAMMGQMNVVPVLGDSFNRVFPMFVCFLCVCNLLNVYSRLVQFFGLDALEFEWAPSASTDTSELLAEGRRLIERERRRRSEERSLLEMHDRNGSRCNDEPGASGRAVPLKLHISRLIEDGTLPSDWNAHSV